MTKKIAKPFLKWAGGKTQLISEISKAFPQKLLKKEFNYIEPFVGSGAVLFWILNNFPNTKNIVINDINQDLINVYKIIKKEPKKLIKILKILEEQFHLLENSLEQQREYYNKKRKDFNSRNLEKIEQAGIFIFLNKTCFNGLYRVNKNNEFNVPMGKYKNPTICDSENIIAVSKMLKNVKILCGDYSETIKYADKNTLFVQLSQVV